MSAANVDAIETINNPSTRFDAAGMAGIINSSCKQEQQLGLSGDAGLGLGIGRHGNPSHSRSVHHQPRSWLWG